MALDKTVMAQSIIDNIKAVNPDIGASQEAVLVTYWEPICQGIIDHFKNSGVVLPGTFLDSLSAPITGQGTIN